MEEGDKLNSKESFAVVVGFSVMLVIIAIIAAFMLFFALIPFIF